MILKMVLLPPLLLGEFEDKRDFIVIRLYSAAHRGAQLGVSWCKTRRMNDATVNGSRVTVRLHTRSNL